MLEYERLRDSLDRIRLVCFDFDGVFTDNMVLVSEDGRESVVCNRSDGLGLKMLKDLGIHLAILSTETNPVVSARAKKLAIQCRQGLEDKLEELQRLISSLNLLPSQVAFVGNDINDLSCLCHVGLAVCVADAYSEVKEVCHLVLEMNGGRGAVREFCEILARRKREK